MQTLADNSDDWDDVESQSTTSSTASRKSRSTQNGLRPFPVGMNFGEKTVSIFRELYGIEPLLSTSQVFHQHPRLAYERNRLELEALKIIGRKARVWDVGSGARRHAHYRIHCLCPYLQPGDDVRLNMAIKNGNSVCKHRLEDWCGCGPKADVYLFVHSAYYIRGEELLHSIRLATQRCVYVVGHLFDEAFGGLAGDEAEYRMELQSREPMIAMKVKGNAHWYRHPPLLWDGREAHVGDTRLLVEQLMTVGDTKLWRVSEGAQYVASPDVDWSVALVEPSQRGPVRVPGFDRVTQQSLTANGQLEVEVDMLYGVGKFLMGETRAGKVYVPRELVCSIARRFHGRIRDPALMLDVIHATRVAMNSSRLPEDERLRSQTIVAALAFNLNVRNEIDVMSTVVNRYSKVWELHKHLTGLSPVKVCALSTLMFWSAFAATLFFVGDVTLPVPWELKLGVSGLGAIVCLVYWLNFVFKKWQSRRTGDNWSSTLFHEEEVSNITGARTSSLGTTRFRAFSRLREPLLPPPGQTMEIGEDPRPPRHEGVERTVITLQGVGVASAVPTAPRTDQEAEVTALTHRLLVPVTDVKRHALEKFLDLESTEAGRLLLDVTVQGSATMYEDWINQAKFSLAQKLKFRKCYEEEVRNDREPKLKAYGFDSFVKFEKMKVITEEFLEGLKVRLINGPPDAVKVACGPWMARVYSAVKRAWDGVQSKVLYASGMTPDEIGQRCDVFAERCGGWDNIVGVWDDCSAYDSTLENELLSIRDVLYPRMGVPALTMKWLNSTGSKGFTKHGIKFDLGKKVIWDGTEVALRRLFSGEMDTNLIGTIINALAHCSALPESWNYLMLVCGDDNLLLIDRNCFELQVVEDLKVHLMDLGLKPTQGVSTVRGDWEFCSKLLWPARDRQTGKTVTVLGPKPGRWLHRIGWSLTTPNQMNFRQSMLSSMNDVAHIPLLNTYVSQGLRLSTGMRASGREYSELKHVSKSYEMVPEALSILESRYGVTPLHVEEFCSQIKGCTRVPCVLDVAWVAAAAKRDEE